MRAEIRFCPATVTQIGFPSAISTSKKGPPTQTMLYLCLRSKRLLWMSWDGVISSLVSSSAVKPLIGEMMQTLPAFFSISGFR